jgi:hypothetical protein
VRQYPGFRRPWAKATMRTSASSYVKMML